MRKKKSYEDELTEAFSSVLRELRTLRGLSQGDLSKSAGIHRAYICDLERTPRNVSVKNLSRLADALDIAPSKLVAAVERRIERARKKRV